MISGAGNALSSWSGRGLVEMRCCDTVYACRERWRRALSEIRFIIEKIAPHARPANDEPKVHRRDVRVLA